MLQHEVLTAMDQRQMLAIYQSNVLIQMQEVKYITYAPMSRKDVTAELNLD